MDYHIVEAETPQDHFRVDEFVRDHFLPDMPLIRAFGLEHSLPPRASPAAAQKRGGFCLMAVDAQGGIVGVAVNREIPTVRTAGAEMTTPGTRKEKARVLQRHLPHLSDQIHIKKSRTMEMMELLEWVERDAQLDTLPERTIELRVLAIHREWRRLGVATRLAEESARLAGERGWRAVRVCCTSEYTARLARALGWRQHYRLRYTDYPATLVLAPAPPHTCIYYYVAEMKQREDWEIVFVEDHYA